MSLGKPSPAAEYVCQLTKSQPDAGFIAVFNAILSLLTDLIGCQGSSFTNADAHWI